MTLVRTLTIAAVTFTMVAAWASASILAEMRLREAVAAVSDRPDTPMNVLGLASGGRNPAPHSFDAF